MNIVLRRQIPLIFICLLIVAGCNYRPPRRGETTPPTGAPAVSPAAPIAETPTPVSERLLTVCMGQEPASLFVYADSSAGARAIRQAIYDGPYDVVGYQLQPVLFGAMPTQAGGDVVLEPVGVSVGDVVSNAAGLLVKLADGVQVMPSGCNDSACAVVFNSQSPVQMEQAVVRFRLRQGILWSDGETLTADDSVYGYELALELYPGVRAELIDRTASYRALDDLTVEWRGVPGYRSSGLAAHFFPPLPRHAWSAFSQADLLAAELVNRKPLGWGPYVVDDWVAGDHITLSKNPNYFRSGENLPVFNKLVFRFIPDPNQALSALQAGECDVLDETNHLETLGQPVAELQAGGQASVNSQPGTAWEHLDFAIQSLNPPESGGPPAFFASKEVRQAVAYCTDRERMAAELSSNGLAVPDSFVAATHPLVNPELRRYSFDPVQAGSLLDAAGWIDADGNSATPRTAQGVAGFVDGTAFEVTLLIGDEPEKQRLGQILQETIRQCGIKINVSPGPAESVFAPGPEGQVFGRNFTLAQFGWVSAIEPPCYLYTTSEIPGPYPQYPKGWGGANFSGYSNPEYDRVCRMALTTLPESAEYRSSHMAAQAIFAEELPSLPLYLRLKTVVTRPDFCGISIDSSTETALWNIESFNYGEPCP